MQWNAKVKVMEDVVNRFDESGIVLGTGGQRGLKN